MACLNSTGYIVPCKGMAGITEVYIADYNSTLGYTLGTASSLNQIVAFTGATGSGFHKFEQGVEVASFTEAGNFSEANGTAFFEQTLEITLISVNQTLIDLLANLGRSRQRVIILDRMGNYFLMGKTQGTFTSAVAGGLGKAGGDLNGYTVTIMAKEYDPLVQVTSIAAASVIS